jgi:tellurite resistance protein TerA
MVSKSPNSQDSLAEATRSRASFSGHGNALGAAGRRQMSFDPDNAEDLRVPGQSIAISPGSNGFEEILIGVAWDPLVKKQKKLLGLIERKKIKGVDLDIGCLYELHDGRRGAIQAFGEKWGAYDEAPFISLSGDERKGERKGYDEILSINGAHWSEIKRILVYLYIYKGVPNWAVVNPRVMVDVPGENDLYVSLSVDENRLNLCAIGGLENIRGGIKLTNYTEYFPGHEEMDRAFGFGLEWGEGKKR